jgi:hypothetical protein
VINDQQKQLEEGKIKEAQHLEKIKSVEEELSKNNVSSF